MDTHTFKKLPQVGVLRMPSFLSKSLRLPKKHDLWRTSLTKKCCYGGNNVDNHVILSFMLEVLHWRSLGHSWNPNRWRTHFVADHITPIPINSWLVHFPAVVWTCPKTCCWCSLRNYHTMISTFTKIGRIDVYDAHAFSSMLGTRGNGWADMMLTHSGCPVHEACMYHNAYLNH